MFLDYGVFTAKLHRHVNGFVKVFGWCEFRAGLGGLFLILILKKSLGVVQGRLIAIVNKIHHMSMETLRRQIHFTTY
jgi:hypothetical protein